MLISPSRFRECIDMYAIVSVFVAILSFTLLWSDGEKREREETNAVAFSLFVVDSETARFVQYLFSRRRERSIVVLNVFFVFLYYSFRSVVSLTLGSLRFDERVDMKELAVNFALFKIVLIATILEPNMVNLGVWILWFGIVCFVKLLARASRLRGEFVACDTGQNGRRFDQSPGLLGVVFVLNLLWLYFSIVLFRQSSWSVLMLFAYESFVNFVDIGHALVLYGLLNFRDANDGPHVHSTYAHRVATYADILTLQSRLLHYVHLLTLKGVSFTLFTAIIGLSARSVWSKLRIRCGAVWKHRKEMRRIESELVPVSGRSIESSDETCSICLGKLSVSPTVELRRCSHMFHRGCLLAWFDHVGFTSQLKCCPMCRASFEEEEVVVEDEEEEETPSSRDEGYVTESRLGRDETTTSRVSDVHETGTSIFDVRVNRGNLFGIHLSLASVEGNSPAGSSSSSSSGGSVGSAHTGCGITGNCGSARASASTGNSTRASTSSGIGGGAIQAFGGACG
eukprot:g231.t1